MKHFKNAHKEESVIPENYEAVPDQSTANNQESPNLYCDICDERFKYPSQYKTHYNKNHFNKNTNPESSKVVQRPSNISNQADTHLYCVTCDKEYTSEALYKNHFNTMHPKELLNPESGKVVQRQSNISYQADTRLYCVTCDKKYTSKRLYKNHFNTLHPDEFVNPEIFRALGSKSKPSISKKSKNNPDLYCVKCDRQYTGQKTYENHCNNKHRNEDTHIGNSNNISDQSIDSTAVITTYKYYCAECNKYIYHRLQYKKHCKYKHAKNKPQHDDINPRFNHYDKSDFPLKKRRKVKYCRTKKNANEDKQSDQIVSLDQNRPMFCDICKRKFKHDRAYTKHINNAHNDDHISPTLCTLCNLLCETPELHESHLCDPKNKTIINRKRGRPAEYAKPITYCSICQVDYIDDHNYNAHLLMFHEKALKDGLMLLNNARTDKNESTLTCQSCNLEYRTASSYNSHLVNFHKNFYQDKTLPPRQVLEANDSMHPLYCFTCKFVYDSYTSFNTHLYDVHHVSKDEVLRIKRIQYTKKAKKQDTAKNNDADSIYETVSAKTLPSPSIAAIQPSNMISEQPTKTLRSNGINNCDTLLEF